MKLIHHQRPPTVGCGFSYLLMLTVTVVSMLSWRECLVRGLTGRLSSLWLMLLLSWGVIVPTQAATIFSYDGPLSGTPVSHLQYPDNNDLDLVNTDFTLSACIIQTKRNPGYLGVIMAKRNGGDGWAFGLAGDKDTGKTTGDVRFKTQGRGSESVIRSPVPLSLNQRYHVVVTYKKSGTAEIFVDGKSVVSGYVAPPIASNRFLRVGRETAAVLLDQGYIHGWNGTLSNLKIDNTVVSLDEIKIRDAKCRGISIFDLTATKTGDGTITGQGINCGSQCKTQLVKDTVITLTATPGTGSIFNSWGGACTGTSTTCKITMTQTKTVTATFSKPGATVTPPTVGTGTVKTRNSSCGTSCQVDIAKNITISTADDLPITATMQATYDPATGILHLPAIEVFGQTGEIEVFQADLIWKADNSRSWFELVNRQNSVALAGTPENAIYNLDTNTLRVPLVAVQGRDETEFYTGELQLISADNPQRFVVILVKEIENSLIDSLLPNP